MGNLSLRQCQFVTALAELIRYGNSSLGYGIKISELNRDVEKELRYIAEGKSHLKNPYDCSHVELRGADLAILYQGKVHCEGELFRPLGVYWEKLGGRWGGRFGLEDKPREVQDKELGWDSCHFEFRRE